MRERAGYGKGSKNCTAARFPLIAECRPLYGAWTAFTALERQPMFMPPANLSRRRQREAISD